MLERDKTALLVIDFQDKLLPKIFNAEAIVPEAVRLIVFAGLLELPVLATEQYPRGLGATTEPVARALGDVPRRAKTAFGCFGDAAFVEAARDTGRSQILVTGIEAHVCVMQTVLAGLEGGYEMFIVRDATGSRRESDCAAGLERMARAGATLVSAEMAMFELLRDAATPEFKRVLPLLK